MVAEDGLAVTLVAEEAYPLRLAQISMTNLLEQFRREHHEPMSMNLDDVKGDVDFDLPSLRRNFDLMQRERTANRLRAQIDRRLQDVQKMQEEVKTVMNENIMKAMIRGENIQEMDSRAEEIDDEAARLNKDARSLNTCCFGHCPKCCSCCYWSCTLL